MTNYLFLHAHPDDEAIFTGGIIRKLINDGHNVHVVFATGGELGANPCDDISTRELRQAETNNAAKILGVSSINFLGFHDSGLSLSNYPENAFASCNVEDASIRLSALVDRHDINVMICDDKFGIYGHPDHVQAHKVGKASAELCGVNELYYSTVDREYLHFVETHLVEEASKSRDVSMLKMANSTLGMSSVEITHTLYVGDVITQKRDAMAAHASQIDDTSSALSLDYNQFKAVYGHEWFVKAIDNSPIDSFLKYCV